MNFINNKHEQIRRTLSMQGVPSDSLLVLTLYQSTITICVWLIVSIIRVKEGDIQVCAFCHAKPEGCTS